MGGRCRDTGQQDGHRVVRCVIGDARKQAARLHRDDAENNTDKRGHNRLLQDSVGDAKERRAQKNRRPASADGLES